VYITTDKDKRMYIRSAVTTMKFTVEDE